MTRYVWPLIGGFPLLDAVVGLSDREKFTKANAGEPTPTPVDVRFLLDTGSAFTCLDNSIVHALGLTVRGFETVVTATTGPEGQDFDKHEIALTLIEAHTNRKALYRPRWPVIAADFSGQGIGGLIGRDMLFEFDVCVSGRAGTLILDI